MESLPVSMDEQKVIENDSGISLKDWKLKSGQGKVCGILGCLADLEAGSVRCDHCGNHYCNEHKWVIGTPGHGRR